MGGDSTMWLTERATLLHARSGKAKRIDPLDVSKLARKTVLLGALALTAAALAGCAQSPVHTSRSDWSAPARQTSLLRIKHKHPTTDVATTGSLPQGASVGVASFYTEGASTASGERLNPNALTAAHPTLPFGTHLRITSVSSGRSVVVRVNDRGPFLKGRAVDVSYSAAKQLGITERGVAKVKMEVVQ
jgi:rare lipoprotein A